LPGAGRNITEFVEGLSKSLGILSKVDPERNLFRRGERLYVVRRDQYGKPIFEEMTPKRFVTWAERFIEIGRYTKKAIDELTAEETEESGGRFYKESMTEQISSIVLSTDTFVRSFPKIGRLLDVPIPVQKGEEIIYTKPGFNPDLEIYCDSQFTEVKPLRLEDGKLDLEQARKVIEQVHEGFQFADEQSKTHAVARLFTPYCRGLMGFEAKTPLWYFEANRPGPGKDYLSGITHTVYLGYSFEDTPIGNSEEETTKRISSALQSGRRMMHFANCQGRLDDKSLMQAVTGKTFNCRRLGSNSGASDLQLRNELDISLSANSGLTYQEDFERKRSVKRILN